MLVKRPSSYAPIKHETEPTAPLQQGFLRGFFAWFGKKDAYALARKNEFLVNQPHMKICGQEYWVTPEQDSQRRRLVQEIKDEMKKVVPEIKSFKRKFAKGEFEADKHIKFDEERGVVKIVKAVGGQETVIPIRACDSQALQALVNQFKTLEKQIIHQNMVRVVRQHRHNPTLLKGFDINAEIDYTDRNWVEWLPEQVGDFFGNSKLVLIGVMLLPDIGAFVVNRAQWLGLGSVVSNASTTGWSGASLYYASIAVRVAVPFLGELGGLFGLGASYKVAGGRTIEQLIEGLKTAGHHDGAPIAANRKFKTDIEPLRAYFERYEEMEQVEQAPALIKTAVEDITDPAKFTNFGVNLEYYDDQRRHSYNPMRGWWGISLACATLEQAGRRLARFGHYLSGTPVHGLTGAALERGIKEFRRNALSSPATTVTADEARDGWQAANPKGTIPGGMPPVGGNFPAYFRDKQTAAREALNEVATWHVWDETAKDTIKNKLGTLRRVMSEYVEACHWNYVGMLHKAGATEADIAREEKRYYEARALQTMVQNTLIKVVFHRYNKVLSAAATTPKSLADALNATYKELLEERSKHGAVKAGKIFGLSLKGAESAPTEEEKKAIIEALIFAMKLSSDEDRYSAEEVFEDFLKAQKIVVDSVYKERISATFTTAQVFQSGIQAV